MPGLRFSRVPCRAARYFGVRVPGPAHLIQHQAKVVQPAPVQREHLLDGGPPDAVELRIGGPLPLARGGDLRGAAIPQAFVTRPVVALQRARAALCVSTSSVMRALVTVLSAALTTMASPSLARSAADRSSVPLTALPLPWRLAGQGETPTGHTRTPTRRRPDPAVAV